MPRVLAGCVLEPGGSGLQCRRRAGDSSPRPHPPASILRTEPESRSPRGCGPAARCSARRETAVSGGFNTLSTSRRPASFSPPLAKGAAMSETPVVLFACVHNSGRSVAARVFTEHYARGAVEARSAGSEPKGSVNPVVAQVLAERGLSTEAETGTMLDLDTVHGADVVITMGCGESCPFVPGKRYEDWQVQDPAGQDLETVRSIVADVDGRVRALLAELGVPV